MKEYEQMVSVIAALIIILAISIAINIVYITEYYDIEKQNKELFQANQHLKSENTFLQKERAWNKSDKRLLKK